LDAVVGEELRGILDSAGRALAVLLEVQARRDEHARGLVA
jgi:hypothetical protein